MDSLISSRVDVPGTDNLRDLGGLPGSKGRRVKLAVLFRGEALAHPAEGAGRVALWNDEHLEAYRSLGLALVIDLRAVGEAGLSPSAWAEPTEAELRSIPIAEGGEGDATDYMRQIRAGTLRRFSAHDLASYYAQVVRERVSQFGLALEAIADPTSIPVLVHCTAGKDRTGLLIALLLEILGTPRELIVADYALTGIFRPNRVAAYADLLESAGIEPADVSALFDTPPDAMQSLLDGIDKEFGSVREFLASRAGLGEETFTALENLLLETG